MTMTKHTVKYTIHCGDPFNGTIELPAGIAAWEAKNYLYTNQQFYDWVALERTETITLMDTRKTGKVTASDLID